MALTEAEELELLELEEQESLASQSVSRETPAKNNIPVQDRNIPQERSGIEKAVNIGAAYTTGRTWGMGPKIAAGIGAPIAKTALEIRELTTGKEAPSIGELYKTGVDVFSRPAEQAKKDNPVLAKVAEIAGGAKTAGSISKTATAKKVGTGLASRVSSLAQKAGAGNKAAGLIGKSVSGGIIAESASRLYQAGQAPVGEEINTATGSQFPVAGVIGVAAPVVGAGLGTLKGKLGPKISQEKKAVIALAKKHGIPLSLDKLTDSKFYKTLISEGETVPLSGAQKFTEKAQKALNKATAKSFGQDADSITPEVVAKAYDDLGAKFQSFTKGKRFEPGQEFYSSIDDIANKASYGHYGKDGADFLQTNLDRIRGLIDENGIIKGERLDKLRREFAELARDRYDDIGSLADDLESVLTDIISDSDDKIAKAITDTKYQYKNLKTIQRIVLKDQVDGNVRPALLTQAVKAKFGEDALAKGQAGDLGELARVGQLLKTEIPNSGTAQRTAARHLLTGNTVGAVPTFAFGGPIAAGAQLGLSAAGMGLNRALQSRNYSQDLILQAIKNAALVPYREMGVKTPLLAGSMSAMIEN